MAENIVRRFSSFGEFVAHVDKVSDKHASSHAKESSHGRFYQTANWAEGMTLAQEGWMEVRPQVDNLTATLSAQLRETMHIGVDYVHGPMGSTLNIGLYAQGLPHCVVRPVLVEQPNTTRVVRILVSVVVNASVSTDTIVKRGVAVAALVELLGAANKAVEIYVEDTTKNNRGRLHTTLVQIKEAAEPLDINRIMFAMGHPSMERRLMFGCQEGENSTVRNEFGFTADGGYSKSADPIMGPELGSDTVVLPTLTYNSDWGAKASVDWIVATLRASGVEVTED